MTLVRSWNARGALALTLVCLTAMWGCSTTMGYVPEQVKGQKGPGQAATYAEVREWALGVADGYDSRSTAARQSGNFSALLAGAAAAAVTLLGAGSAAITAIPITAFIGGTGTLYTSEPKAVIYRYASDNIKDLVRLSDARVHKRAKPFAEEALCLQGNVHAVMRKVGEYVTLLEPQNVSDRLKKTATTDHSALQKLALAVGSDYTDLKHLEPECQVPLEITQGVEVEPGGTAIVKITGGAHSYTAVPLDAAATLALTVTPPANDGLSAIVSIKANEGAKSGGYGVVIKDSVGGTRVAVITVKPASTPHLTVVPVLDGRVLEPDRDTVVAVVSGGVAPYVAKTARADEKALEVGIHAGADDRAPKTLKVRATPHAVGGQTYGVYVEDAKKQREYVEVRVRPTDLRVEPLPKGRRAQATRRDTLPFAVSGGTPPYTSSVEVGAAALRIDSEPPMLLVSVLESAVPGDVYYVKVSDAAGSFHQIPIPIAREATDAVVVLDPTLIAKAQTALQAGRFGVTKIDGKLGPETTTAVKAFQKSQQLPETGVLDARTLRDLKVL